MKKVLIISGVIVVALVALGLAGFAYAQAQPPTQPEEEAQGYWDMMGQNRHFGMMGGWRQVRPGFGMMGRMSGFQMDWSMMSRGVGPMHPFMIEALAEALGLEVDDLQAKLQAGESPWDIAKSQGLSDDEITALIQEAHTKALDKAVAAGVITQEQADFMKGHMGQGGHMFGGGRMMKAWRGWTGSPAVKGAIHEYKLNAFSAVLGLTPEELNSRIENGETMWEVAQSLGLTEEQFREKRVEATQSAINQALADGKITQAQADWMLNRMNQAGGFGPGAGPCGGWRFGTP